MKQISRKCATCRRVQGTPYRPSPTLDLPMELVSLDLPFSHTGLDFIGPLHRRNGKPSKEKGSDKVYICFFTCISTRAIYLELTSFLSIDSFLLALCRFVSHQGLPVTLMSDNTKTFRSASGDIRKIIQSDKVMWYLTDNRITLNFIIERATNHNDGGQGNCRSTMLTYVYDDEESIFTPLTPSHLINGRCITNAPCK